jgi:hypothetical protein
MDIKSNLQILSEAAAVDLKNSTAGVLKADAVKEAYSNIEECIEPTVTEAADVVVTQTGDNRYYTEMTALAPFMMDAGIKSIAKALDMVAEANGLEPKEVGLIVDSQEYIESTIDSATAKAKSTGNYKILENAVAKVHKNNQIIAKLLSEGYKVAKKNSESKVCPKCGKAKCKCECDGAGCSNGKAVIAEKGCGDKKGCSKKEEVCAKSSTGAKVLGEKKGCCESSGPEPKPVNEGMFADNGIERYADANTISKLIGSRDIIGMHDALLKMNDYIHVINKLKNDPKTKHKTNAGNFYIGGSKTTRFSNEQLETLVGAIRANKKALEDAYEKMGGEQTYYAAMQAKAQKDMANVQMFMALK